MTKELLNALTAKYLASTQCQWKSDEAFIKTALGGLIADFEWDQSKSESNANSDFTAAVHNAFPSILAALERHLELNQPKE